LSEFGVLLVLIVVRLFGITSSPYA